MGPGDPKGPSGGVVCPMEEPLLDDVLSPSRLAYILDGARRHQGTPLGGLRAPWEEPPLDDVLSPSCLAYILDGARRPKGTQRCTPHGGAPVG